ncbi:uncharacterized protein N7473_002679 [Penicillium subrubescens]|uniref:uncharacterized protein n=1 Tax=Penicillium subrubescens TaxID=1316194 RepID=UPI0025459D2D|nr:uncharacterized protein N7473_002679 [Penicillium subrubescens]KAJ5905763.1 hypothetical protein N7473_002679 [Penicillium subrubescens]
MVKESRQFAAGAAPSGGWQGDARESVSLPDTITCMLCDRELPLERYSPSAKKRLLAEIRKKGIEVLDNQQVVRCDCCGTQSRSEIPCMTCNQVRSINEFAHTQRQLQQPTCLLCQDSLQLDERDKMAEDPDEITELPQVLDEGDNVTATQDELDKPVSELTRAMANLDPGRVTEKNSESAPVITRTIGMAENIMRQEPALEENEDTFVPTNRRFGMRAESWSGGASSASAIRAPTQNQNIIGDMSFAVVFGYDDDVYYTSSYQW